LREIKKRSPVPVYGLAAVWLAYCLIFPLYKLWHFIILICLGAVTYVVLSYIFPGKTIQVEIPKEPPKQVKTGNEEIDAMLREGERAASEFARLRGAIPNEDVRARIDELAQVTDKIFKDLIDDPNDYKQVKRFAEYFLPTTLKLLNEYDRLGAAGIETDGIAGAKKSIEDILGSTLDVFKKQYDALFADRVLDIEAEIKVLETKIKQEGFGTPDFKVSQPEQQSGTAT